MRAWLPDLLRYGAFVCLGLVLLIEGSNRELSKVDVAGQAAFVAAGVGLFGCAIAAKRLHGQFIERTAATDSRAPILFLRSFEEELQTRYALVSLSPVRLFSALFWGVEDRLMGTFRLYGPFTLLDSRSRLAPSGAERVSVPDDQWRQRVHDLMLDAGLIVIAAGQTRGVLWEIELALTLEDRRKVLIVTRNGLEYEFVRASVSKALGGTASLPPWPHWFFFTRTYFTYVDEADRLHSVTPSVWRAIVDRWQAPYRSSRGAWKTLVRCVPGFFAQNKLPLPS